MAYHTINRWGHGESNTPVESMIDILDQLDLQDEEHCSVSLSHESEWCLGAYPGGLLVWENLGQGEPRHMTGVSRERVLTLWMELSNGNLSVIDEEPWQSGYGP